MHHVDASKSKYGVNAGEPQNHVDATDSMRPSQTNALRRCRPIRASCRCRQIHVWRVGWLWYKIKPPSVNRPFDIVPESHCALSMPISFFLVNEATFCHSARVALRTKPASTHASQEPIEHWNVSVLCRQSLIQNDLSNNGSIFWNSARVALWTEPPARFKSLCQSRAN